MGITYHRNSGTPRKISRGPSVAARRPDQTMLPSRSSPVLRPIPVELPLEHPRTEGSRHLRDRARVWRGHQGRAPSWCVFGPVREPHRGGPRRCGPARPPGSPDFLGTSRSPSDQRSPRWWSPTRWVRQRWSSPFRPRVGVRGGGRPEPACARSVRDQGCRGAGRWSGRVHRPHPAQSAGPRAWDRPGATGARYLLPAQPAQRRRAAGSREGNAPVWSSRSGAARLRSGPHAPRGSRPVDAPSPEGPSRQGQPFPLSSVLPWA